MGNTWVNKGWEKFNGGFASVTIWTVGYRSLHEQ